MRHKARLSWSAIQLHIQRQINRVVRDIGGVFKRRVGCNNGREGHRLHKYLHHTGPIDAEPSGGNVPYRVAGFLAAIEIDAIKR